MLFDEIPEFERDVKQLLKKYRSLQDEFFNPTSDLSPSPPTVPSLNYDMMVFPSLPCKFLIFGVNHTHEANCHLSIFHCV